MSNEPTGWRSSSARSIDETSTNGCSCERGWIAIVQESLQNVRKHAAASDVAITMDGDTMVIADNGPGFDLLRLASRSTSNFGLQFMRERAELMGGQVQIESRQGEGTRILVRLPALGQKHTKEETDGSRD